jgi:hypothetical protein
MNILLLALPFRYYLHVQKLALGTTPHLRKPLLCFQEGLGPKVCSQGTIHLGLFMGLLNRLKTGKTS